MSFVNTLLSNQSLVSNVIAALMIVVTLSVAGGIVKWFGREFGSGETGSSFFGLLLKVSCVMALHTAICAAMARSHVMNTFEKATQAGLLLPRPSWPRS